MCQLNFCFMYGISLGSTLVKSHKEKRKGRRKKGRRELATSFVVSVLMLDSMKKICKYQKHGTKRYNSYKFHIYICNIYL